MADVFASLDNWKSVFPSSIRADDVNDHLVMLDGELLLPLGHASVVITAARANSRRKNVAGMKFLMLLKRDLAFADLEIVLDNDGHELLSCHVLYLLTLANQQTADAHPRTRSQSCKLSGAAQ